MNVLLEARGLAAGYGGLPVVRDLDLHVNEGEVVALIGANGAGKSTTLLTLGGVLPTSAGSVSFHGSPLRGPLHARARKGIGFIPEGRSVFGRLTVAHNLRLAGDPEPALRLFPLLRGLLDRPAGLLSGGEQQILVLARMLLRSPRLLLIDELSLGLAPLIVSRLLDEVRAIADTGVGVLLVEQHARKALRICDRAYLMQRGTIQLTGSSAELLQRFDEIERAYLQASSSNGVAAG